MGEEERAPSGVTEALFREVNERVRELNLRLEELTPYGSWSCECSDTACLGRVDLTLDEYDAVRAEATHFVVVPSPDHVDRAVETVTLETDRYWIVEKLGSAARVAMETNRPRTTTEGGLQ